MLPCDDGQTNESDQRDAVPHHLMQMPWSEVTRFLLTVGHQIELRDDDGNGYVVMTRKRYEELTAAAQTATNSPANTRSSPPRSAVPTERERQCLQLVFQGLTTADIARRLGLAQNTAAQHLAAARRRYGVSSSLAAAAAAREQGLII